MSKTRVLEITSCKGCPFLMEVDYNLRFKGEIHGCIAVPGKSFFDITGDPKYHALIPEFIPDMCPNKNNGVTSAVTYVWRSV